MLKIGIIGAGHISERHLAAFQQMDNCEVKAISDLSEELAQQRATDYGVDDVYTYYKELLADKAIDAVVIATPTFAHKPIVIDALNSGKHVLCEKPPALNAKEVKECEDAAKESGKLLMYALVCRFRAQDMYLKKLIESGKMGNFVSAEAVRISRCGASQGWLSNREKGGGTLRDECVHELDAALWFMGYPKPKTVVATESFVNSDLGERMKLEGWKTYHKINCERDVESVIDGFVVLDNGVGLHVKAASILNTVDENRVITVAGENFGAKIAPDENYKMHLNLVEIADNTFVDSHPQLPASNPFKDMLKHFVDCVTNGTECLCRPEEAFTLMQVVDAMYESSKTGKPVIFE